MVCNKCGQKIPKDAVFCPNCGNSVTKKSIASTDNGRKGKKNFVKWLIPVGIVGAFIVVVIWILIIIRMFGNNGEKNAVQNKLPEKQYNEILDAYLKYCEEKSNVYENMSMTLTMDADNKPILLVFFGEDNDCYLEINTYEDGNVNVLQMIKCQEALLRENGILSTWNKEEIGHEESEEYQRFINSDMIQIKNNKINVLAEYDVENDEHKYKLYCDDKNYVIDINDSDTERRTPIKQYEKEIEKEIKEWFSYIYGDDEHYLDWMSELPIADVVFLLQLYPRILDGVNDPFIPNGISVSSDFSEQNLIDFREMIYLLKEEPRYTWKDFWIFETDRLCEQVDYYKKVQNSDTKYSQIRVNFFYGNDISWLTELKTIKKMPFIKADTNIEHLNHYDVCFPDGIYTYLRWMVDGICYETEDKHYEYIQLIDSYKKRENNTDLFEELYDFENFVQNIYDDIVDNWICKYLGVSSLKETVGKTVDNEAILTDFYEWVQSDEHQKLFEQEYEKRIKEKEWKQPYIDYFKSKSDSDNKGYSDDWIFKILDINEDGKPEIFVFGNSMADGDYVFCIDREGKVQKTGLAAGVMRYQKDKNLVFHSGGHMDNYFDNVYTIDDRGCFSQIHTGTWTTEWFSGETSLEDPIVTYFWDEKEVNEDTYNKSLKEAFDENNAIYINEGGILSNSDGELRDIIRIINEIKHDDILARNN